MSEPAASVSGSHSRDFLEQLRRAGRKGEDVLSRPLFFISFLCLGLSSPRLGCYLPLSASSFLPPCAPGLLTAWPPRPNCAPPEACSLSWALHLTTGEAKGQPVSPPSRSGLIVGQDYDPTQPELGDPAAWNPLASCERCG